MIGIEGEQDQIAWSGRIAEKHIEQSGYGGVLRLANQTRCQIVPLEGGGSPSVSPADDANPSPSSSHLDYHRDAGGSSASPGVCRQQERLSASNQTRSWLFGGSPLSSAGDLQDLSVARRRAASVVSHVAPSTRLCSAQQTTYWPRSTTADALLVSLA